MEGDLSYSSRLPISKSYSWEQRHTQPTRTTRVKKSLVQIGLKELTIYLMVEVDDNRNNNSDYLRR